MRFANKIYTATYLWYGVVHFVSAKVMKTVDIGKCHVKIFIARIIYIVSFDLINRLLAVPFHFLFTSFRLIFW